MHIIAAKAVAFGEAQKPEFALYQRRIVSNAASLAEALSEHFDLVSGGTDNHLMLVDLRRVGLTGKEMEQRLDSVYITANKIQFRTIRAARWSRAASASGRRRSRPADLHRRTCARWRN
jgi:glycine/serine hydroxymethyltransferase